MKSGKKRPFFSRDKAEIRKGDVGVGPPRNGENRGEIREGERQERNRIPRNQREVETLESNSRRESDVLGEREEALKPES